MSGDLIWEVAMKRFVPSWTRRRCLQATWVGLLSPYASQFAMATSSTAEAEAMIDKLANTIWDILANPEFSDAERVSALAEAIGAKIDATLLGRLVLGRYWRQLSDYQRRRYQERFPSFVTRTLASRLNTYARDARGRVGDHFQVLAGRSAGKQDILVRSKVLPTSGPSLAVDWRLRAHDDGFVIIDLVIEGVSLLVSERSQFAAVIERRSIDDLIEELGSSVGS